jgi:hypothetical protein
LVTRKVYTAFSLFPHLLILPPVFLDGKTFADTILVIAMGVRVTGEKRFLGFVETAKWSGQCAGRGGGANATENRSG